MYNMYSIFNVDITDDVNWQYLCNWTKNSPHY